MPPADPPPPPPFDPPPASYEGSGNPWERREEHGFVGGLIENLKLFVTAPGEAFRQTREGGDYASPIFFAVIVGWAMAIVGQIWNMMFSGAYLSMMPAEFRDQVGHYFAGSGMGLVAQMIMAPIFIVIGIFIWSAILHLCMMLVGGLAESRAGFEGTFRVVSYSMVAQIANIIPVLGGMVSFVWAIILGVIGLATLHRSTNGKAIAAILIPIVLCCICCVLGGLIFGAGIASFINAQQ